MYGVVNVTAQTGCGWTAATNASWLRITNGATGSGNGTVGYVVDANPSLNPLGGNHDDRRSSFNCESGWCVLY